MSHPQRVSLVDGLIASNWTAAMLPAGDFYRLSGGEAMTDQDDPQAILDREAELFRLLREERRKHVRYDSPGELLEADKPAWLKPNCMEWN